MDHSTASDTRTPPLRGDAALIRSVGYWGLCAAFVNMMVGSGIYLMPGALASNLGALSPLAIVLGALTIIPVMLCFAAIGSRVTGTGGPYAFVSAAFGPFSGFCVGALQLIANVAASAGIAAGLAEHLSSTFADFGGGATRVAFILLLYTLLVTLNAFGMRGSTRSVVVLALAKLLPLMLLAVIGLAFVHGENLRWPDWPSVAALGAGTAYVLFSFSGIETALIPSGEVRNNAQVVPRATFSAIAFVIALYLCLQVVAQGVMGPALAGNTTPLPSTAAAIWPGAFSLLLIGASVSMLGTLQGDMVGSPRLLFAFARDGLLPAALARVTPTGRAPLAAILLYAVVAACLACAGNFAPLILLSSGAIAIVYIGVCLAAYVVQRRDATATQVAFRLRGGALIPLWAIALLGFVLSTLSRAEWRAMAIGLAATIAIRAITLALRRKASTSTDS